MTWPAENQETRTFIPTEFNWPVPQSRKAVRQCPPILDDMIDPVNTAIAEFGHKLFST
jgi:hypothetical protein